MTEKLSDLVLRSHIYVIRTLVILFVKIVLDRCWCDLIANDVIGLLLVRRGRQLDHHVQMIVDVEVAPAIFVTKWHLFVVAEFIWVFWHP